MGAKNNTPYEFFILLHLQKKEIYFLTLHQNIKGNQSHNSKEDKPHRFTGKTMTLRRFSFKL